ELVALEDLEPDLLAQSLAAAHCAPPSKSGADSGASQPPVTVELTGALIRSPVDSGHGSRILSALITDGSFPFDVVHEVRTSQASRASFRFVRLDRPGRLSCDGALGSLQGCSSCVALPIQVRDDAVGDLCRQAQVIVRREHVLMKPVVL